MPTDSDLLIWLAYSAKSSWLGSNIYQYKFEFYIDRILLFVNNARLTRTLAREAMRPHDDGKSSNRPAEQLPQRQTMVPIASLNEAWVHTLDRCVGDIPINEVILPLMRDCFFGGAMHAVLLLQKGHGDRLTAEIALYITQSRRCR